MNKITFKSKKEASEFLKTKGIDTSNWTKEKWQSINKSQAEIHIQAIAELMWDAYQQSIPKQLKAGEWHIPFGDNFEEDKIVELVKNNFTNLSDIVSDEVFQKEKQKRNDLVQLTKIKIATARCARISYMTLGDDPKFDYKADLNLHDILATSGHWSPFEHIAKCMSDDEYFNTNWSILPEQHKKHSHINNSNYGWCGNFRGWIQYRKFLE